MAIARLRKDGTQDMPCSRSTHSALAATRIRLRPTLRCISHAAGESNEAERRSSSACYCAQTGGHASATILLPEHHHELRPARWSGYVP